MKSKKHHDNESSQFFDKCAEEKIFEEFMPGEEEIVRQLIDEMGPRHDWIVAEPGCGPGRITKLIAKFIGHQGKLYACDFSTRMIEECRKYNFPPQVVISQTHAHDLPIVDGHCDAVICFNAFPHFEDKTEALKEFNRVLKSGDYLWIAHSVSREQVNEIHATASSSAIKHHQLPDEKKIRKMLSKAGFKIERILDGPDRYLLCARKK